MIFRRIFTASKHFRRNCSTKFKSPDNPENLYPGSTISDRFQQVSSRGPDSSQTEFSGFIPIQELKFCYTEGLEGLNVHKVPTKVDIRFHLESASWLSETEKTKLKSKLSNHLTKDGYLVSKSDRTRAQFLNQAEAMRKLRETIWEALNDEETVTEEIKQETLRKEQIDLARKLLREKRS